jgi:hypothetical protein
MAMPMPSFLANGNNSTGSMDYDTFDTSFDEMAK